jgi:hypothetical protein
MMNKDTQKHFMKSMKEYEMSCFGFVSEFIPGI